MRRGIQVLLAVYLILPFSPWWMLWIILGLYGWFASDYKESIFYSGVLAIICWSMKLGVGFLTGGGMLMNRISHMLGLGSSVLLIFISLLLAGILGGLSGISGYHMKQLAHSFFSNTASNQ